ncbi:helix-turn-helix domain-containing protein [Oceanobacter kriegii]|uniref:helix-turn-helix domain-containing protein n=1 Tax=Oceanobacter kriegii TaxID=64972 RepID=UPI00040349CC|nr:helix-turn-helix domain-containing protein [Oceanobacter kriegii]
MNLSSCFNGNTATRPSSNRSLHTPLQLLASNRPDYSTQRLPSRQKADFWVDCINRNMIELDCPDEPECGIDAELTSRQLGALTLNRVKASEHSIQRSNANIRKDDRESAFMCLMLEGDGFAYQGTQCTRSSPGDVVIYNTVRPYAQGFGQNMDMVVIDIPHQVLKGCFGQWDQKDIIRLDRQLEYGGYATKELFNLLRQADSGATAADKVANLMLDELNGLLNQRIRPQGSRALADILLRGKYWIRTHLHEEDLSLERLSHELHTSKRQLARAFQLDNTTVARFIWDERLQRCRDTLLDPSCKQMTVSQVAFRCGFNHPAHFSRAYKQAFGESPSDTRSRLL